MALIDTRSTITQAELDAYNARGVSELEVLLSYELTETGAELCYPPYRIEVTCSKEREDGVSRTIAKLLDSRGWTAKRTRRVRARRNG